MTAVVNINNTQKSNTGSIEAISTITRLDHLLHNSYQAILVIDELSANYSSVGSHYLGSLSDNYNAAYISISAKFTNIQIRCRITEQLFPGVLFDPEQSLAVSLLRLGKETDQPISIVVEHAQNLSFQLLHELSYLAEISKKSKQIINIVLLGNVETVRKIMKEKALFNQKITIISAKTGKSLSFNDQLFSRTRDKFVLKNTKKVMLLIFLIAALLSLSLVILKKRDAFSFSLLPQLHALKQSMKPRVITTKIDQPKSLTKSKLITKSRHSLAIQNMATVAEIYQVLVGKELKSVVKANVKATPQDIFGAITEPIIKKTKLSNTKVSNIEPSKFRLNRVKPSEIDNSLYYLHAKTGYIIQFAGFTEKNIMANNDNIFKNVPHKIYYRLLQWKKNVVITSLLYASKDKAINALKTLPVSISQLDPWIKPLAKVKQEIKLYKAWLRKHN